MGCCVVNVAAMKTSKAFGNCFTQIISLRVLARLRSCSLRGNPVCDGSKQALLVVALLPNLQYLDGAPLLQPTKHEALVQYKSVKQTFFQTLNID